MFIIYPGPRDFFPLIKKDNWKVSQSQLQVLSPFQPQDSLY